MVFREPSGFSTTDLRDAHDRIVQFTSSGGLVWTPDGTHVPGYEVSPDSSYWGPPTYFIGLKTRVCGEFCVFSVRFGTEGGERRAYLTHDYGHSNPGTRVDVEVVGGSVIVTQSSLYPPGTPTLTGTVTTITATGISPVPGARVSRAVSAGYQTARTDENGRYRIAGLVDGRAEVIVDKEGYQRESRQVTLSGDATLDVQLVRR